MAVSGNPGKTPTSPLRYGIGHTPGRVSVYYERLEPLQPTGKPVVVMLPGGGCTGECYLLTADGRPGWAHDFVARGYTVVLPDWAGTGRSGYVADADLTGALVCEGFGALIRHLDAPVVVMTHSMSGAFGWRLIETHGDRIAQLVGVAPAPPGNIQPVAQILAHEADAIEVKGSLHQRYLLRMDRPFFTDLDYLPRKLYGEGRRFPKAVLPQMNASRLAVPARLLYERLNVEGSQLKVGDVASFRDKPILVFTGDDDPDHSREMDGAIVEWLVSLGARAELCYLADRGISGNGHMLMSEDNSAELAGMIMDWLEQ